MSWPRAIHNHNSLFLLSCYLSDPPSHEFAKHVKADTYTALMQNSDYNASDSRDDSVPLMMILCKFGLLDVQLSSFFFDVCENYDGA